MKRILWLDSLRGIASALVVVTHHSKSPEPNIIVGLLTRSYWNEPAKENRRRIQPPPFRLLFNGPSIVALFMVSRVMRSPFRFSSAERTLGQVIRGSFADYPLPQLAESSEYICPLSLYYS